MVCTHSFRQALKQVLTRYLFHGRLYTGHHEEKGKYELGLPVASNLFKVVICPQSNVE
jgi:hypothetical protein